MGARVVVLVGVVLTLAHARPGFAVDNLAASERLGGRIGYVETFDGLDAYYGPGWDVTLYFNERIYSRLYLDVHVGATYLGDLLDPALDDFITQTPGIRSEMRVFYFSVGLVYGIPIGSSPYTLTAAAAAGVYSVSVALASEFVADDLSDQYFGGNGGIGLARRVGTTLSLEMTCTVHYFSTAEGYGDLLWVFTKGTAQDPVLVGVSLGIAVDLH